MEQARAGPEDLGLSQNHSKASAWAWQRHALSSPSLPPGSPQTVPAIQTWPCALGVALGQAWKLVFFPPMWEASGCKGGWEMDREEPDVMGYTSCLYWGWWAEQNLDLGTVTSMWRGRAGMCLCLNTLIPAASSHIHPLGKAFSGLLENILPTGGGIPLLSC